MCGNNGPDPAADYRTGLISTVHPPENRTIADRRLPIGQHQERLAITLLAQISRSVAARSKRLGSSGRVVSDIFEFHRTSWAHYRLNDLQDGPIYDQYPLCHRTCARSGAIRLAASGGRLAARAAERLGGMPAPT